MLSKINSRQILSAKDKDANFLLDNSFFKSILTWAGNVVFPEPGWQDTGATPMSLHLFVCSNNNSILCSHPRLLANLPSQFQLEENKTDFKEHKFLHNSNLIYPKLCLTPQQSNTGFVILITVSTWAGQFLLWGGGQSSVVFSSILASTHQIQ